MMASSLCAPARRCRHIYIGIRIYIHTLASVRRTYMYTLAHDNSLELGEKRSWLNLVASEPLSLYMCIHIRVYPLHK